jgi:periplasmic divalent cation tolerance protein
MEGLSKGRSMQDCKQHDILTVTTTVGSLPDAKSLAHALVEGRLAACVQLEPIAGSVYRWRGKVCDEAEVRLSIKTLPGMEAALQAFFHERHPYEVPQFLAVAQCASEAFAQWVRSEVAAAGAA